MKERIIGFDLARAYAIFGMFIVNFNTVFGAYNDDTICGKFLSLFNGNSSSCFVILAGMGVALMTNRASYSLQESQHIKSVIIKRSWFLFVLGMLLCLWWPADILHFYGGYMHIAAFVIFIPKKYYLWLAALAIVGFHVVWFVIPYETAWNFNTLQYNGFWTIKGFLRNTLYNGWNPIFPWIAYFILGMWLGRQNWSSKVFRKKNFFTGMIVFIMVEVLQIIAANNYFNKDLAFYITADYIPPFLPFMLSTTGFALMLIAACVYLGDKLQENNLIKLLTKTGQMTLTHYVLHLTVGITVLSVISGKAYTGAINSNTAIKPLFILAFAICFYLVSIAFSYYWSRKFKNGPLETLMRKVCK